VQRAEARSHSSGSKATPRPHAASHAPALWHSPRRPGPRSRGRGGRGGRRGQRGGGRWPCARAWWVRGGEKVGRGQRGEMGSGHVYQLAGARSEWAVGGGSPGQSGGRVAAPATSISKSRALFSKNHCSSSNNPPVPRQSVQLWWAQNGYTRTLRGQRGHMACGRGARYPRGLLVLSKPLYGCTWQRPPQSARHVSCPHMPHMLTPRYRVLRIGHPSHRLRPRHSRSHSRRRPQAQPPSLRPTRMRPRVHAKECANTSEEDVITIGEYRDGGNQRRRKSLYRQRDGGYRVSVVPRKCVQWCRRGNSCAKGGERE
jgi:hypothetical protein